MKRDADVHGNSDFPPVTIRCPDCGAFLREIAYAEGDFTVVACGPCGETFRLHANWPEWLPSQTRHVLPEADARAFANAPPRKARTK
jgi:ribosomal protein S27E